MDNHQDSNKMYLEKTRKEIRNNKTRCFKQILDVKFNKTAYSVTSYLTNHPSKCVRHPQN